MPINVAIIGLGLIGGSLGLALLNNWDARVAGYDTDIEVQKKALAMGCINRCGTIKDVVETADYIFICTPIDALEKTVADILPYCRDGCVITDVGSTKQRVVKNFDSMPERVIGIGGHPMAGSEIQGLSGADQYLFENAVYVLTPGINTPEWALKGLSDLIAGIGAQVMIMDAREHDRIVSRISHLPHLVASALVYMISDDQKALTLAAGGFRDTTRIASSSPELWTGILLSNRQCLIESLEKMINLLNDVRTMLLQESSEKLMQFLEEARKTRDSLPARRKGLIPNLQELVCIVPDKPGIIGLLGTWLGKYDINIADIEIIRVREGDGGTIRIGFSSSVDGNRAVEILKEHGIKAWLR